MAVAHALVAPAHAEPPASSMPPLLGISEIRLGALYHDVPGLWSNIGVERPAVDANVEVLFRSVGFAFGGSLRPALGGTINFNGETSKAYADLRWERATPSGIFFALGMGVAVHDGHTELTVLSRKVLGSPVLFHPSAEIGYRFDGRNSVSLFFEHVSNGWTVHNNEGMDWIGVRLGHRFDAVEVDHDGFLDGKTSASAIWTGAYAGVLGGYLRGTTDWKAGGVVTSDAEGGVAGGLAGYGWQSGRAYFGIEGDVSALVPGASVDCTTVAAPCRTKFETLSSLRGRFGLIFDRTMLFASGGLAIGNWDTFGNAKATASTAWANTNFGVAISAGIEHQLGNNLSLRTELMHYGLASREVDVAGSIISTETRGFVGRAALVYAFR